MTIENYTEAELSVQEIALKQYINELNKSKNELKALKLPKARETLNSVNNAIYVLVGFIIFSICLYLLSPLQFSTHDVAVLEFIVMVSLTCWMLVTFSNLRKRARREELEELIGTLSGYIVALEDKINQIKSHL
ncbi:hypothetical protein L0B53_04460 [Vibrio sp. SS-MA-C1-2]|uniref:hypothetical protein n=1 Tax=Vibrio sp. SS-MA-C1-2 TaxID=2908646 RepID=UPI001F1C35B5|nr:hypothetical protein [Vibrio sp. SS-MA-C1-2]UJF17173.1 hypothetical protein L0B53_04460 [Vibrio sp. SS-MA-C1-2]